MSWNYRLVKETLKGIKCEDISHIEIKEVYYDENGNITSWGDAPVIYGDDLKECKECMKLQQEAFNKPLLELVEINGNIKLINSLFDWEKFNEYEIGIVCDTETKFNKFVEYCINKGFYWVLNDIITFDRFGKYSGFTGYNKTIDVTNISYVIDWVDKLYNFDTFTYNI